MKKIIYTILIAFIICFSCKKDEKINVSLFDDYYYSALVYRDYPNDLSLDIFKYYFNKDTLRIIGYSFDLVNNIRTPIKKDTISHSYFIDDNNIYFPFQTVSYNELYTQNWLGPYEYELLRWQIIELDKSKLIIESYNTDLLVGHYEFVANRKK